VSLPASSLPTILDPDSVEPTRMYSKKTSRMKNVFLCRSERAKCFSLITVGSVCTSHLRKSPSSKCRIHKEDSRRFNLNILKFGKGSLFHQLNNDFMKNDWRSIYLCTHHIIFRIIPFRFFTTLYFMPLFSFGKTCGKSLTTTTSKDLSDIARCNSQINYRVRRVLWFTTYCQFSSTKG